MTSALSSTRRIRTPFLLDRSRRSPLYPLLVTLKKPPSGIRAVSASNMVKSIRVYEHGGPEVLKWEDVEIGEPKEGEILVKNQAIGLNFIDVYFRKGVYKPASLPFTPVMEAVGVVKAVGPGLTGRAVGDVVAYAGHLMGSHTLRSRYCLLTKSCQFLPLLIQL